MNPHFLESVLKLAAMFAFEDVADFATEAIERLPPGTITPARKLHLAIAYNVDKWVGPTFKQLLQQPINASSHEEIESLGLFSYHLLVGTQCLIDKLRRDCAWYVPKFQKDPICMTPGYCESAWKREWVNGVSRLIMHPTDYISLQDLRERLEDPGLAVTDLCQHCLQMTVNALLAKNIFEREAHIINDAVQKITDFATDKEVRVKLTEVACAIFGTDPEGRPIPPQFRPLQLADN